MIIGSRTRARALVALGVLVAATFVASAVVARFPAPYRDDWYWLEWVLDGPPTPARLFEPHNEHLVPLARTLYWLQFTIEGSAGWLVFLAALGAQAGIVWLFVREIAARWPDDADTRQTLIGLALVALCFGWQLQSIVFAAAVLFPLAQLFATAAFAGAAYLAAGGPEQSRVLAGSIAAALAAMLTTTHGMLVPLVAALILAARPRTRAAALGFGLLTAAGAATYLVFISSADMTRTDEPATPSLLQSLAYALAFFAPSVTVASAAAGALLGAVLLALGVAAIAAIVRSADARRLEWFAASTMLFVMVSAALAAVGRSADHGVVQSAQSRYATLTMCYWTALAAAVSSLATRRHPLFVRLRPLAAAAVPVALALIAIHAAACVVWMAKAGNIRAARLALVANVQDDEWIASLDPDVWFVYDLATRARAAGDLSIADAAIGRPAGALDGVPPCAGALVLTPTTDGHALRLTGTLATSVSRGWIVDRHGTVRGLAAPAPIADEPAPAPPRVAALVFQSVRTGAWRDGRWRGFASPGHGAYRFVGLSAAGPACVLELANSPL